jgi:hypothetical protein
VPIGVLLIAHPGLQVVRRSTVAGVVWLSRLRLDRHRGHRQRWDANGEQRWPAFTGWRVRLSRGGPEPAVYCKRWAEARPRSRSPRLTRSQERLSVALVEAMRSTSSTVIGARRPRLELVRVALRFPGRIGPVHERCHTPHFT